jgi:hypothetical protein
MSVFPSQTSFVTGDILTATAMNEIGQAINLLDGAQFAAGKNKIINGDFGVWQRGTSFTNTTQYTADRWYANSLYTGDTITQQTFTPGTAPVAGYEGTHYARFVTSATAGTRYFQQRIEDVRTFAGQTVTFSFWAKASAGTTMVSSIGGQNFGSGGSSFVNPTNQTNTLTTSWQRFTQTAAVPSIAGKTIGTSSYLEASFTITTVSTTFEIWGVQLEASQTASNFQTATGTKQGEQAACQRYYEKSDSAISGWSGQSNNTSLYYALNSFQVQKRTSSPTITTTTTTVFGFASSNPTAEAINQTGFRSYKTSNATTNGAYFFYTWTAEAEL